MTATLPDRLDDVWSAAGDPPLCVAFSGGPDSSALLHALAAVRGDARALRAMHVDHGLHADSTSWAAACAATCESLGVPLQMLRVTVQAEGAGIEAAAREARYAALAGHLGEDEWLVTAHHREDQAETVLLKLLRGAGPHGLGGMRERRPLGRGQLWRPLLDIPRGDLRAYAASAGLQVIEDPANRDPRHGAQLPAPGDPAATAAPLAAGRALRWPTPRGCSASRPISSTGTPRRSLAALARRGDGSLEASGWVRGGIRRCARASWNCWLHGARPARADRRAARRTGAPGARGRRRPGTVHRLAGGRSTAVARATARHGAAAGRPRRLDRAVARRRAGPAGRCAALVGTCRAGHRSTARPRAPRRARAAACGRTATATPAPCATCSSRPASRRGARRFCPVLYDAGDTPAGRGRPAGAPRPARPCSRTSAGGRVWPPPG